MLAVPLITGAALRTPPDAVRSLLLAGCFVTGYFGFFAASAWLKSPARRRRRHVAPLITYAAASASLGIAALTYAGPSLLGWTPIFAALLIPALVLASRRNERALAGGALTTAAACGMTLVLTFDSPITLVAEWPASQQPTLISLALFGYFFGTVLHVKSLIRERGNTRMAAASTAWHLAWTVATFPAWGATTSWAWTILFAVATLRTTALTRRTRDHPVRPAIIGAIEIVLSVAVLTCALTTGVPD